MKDKRLRIEDALNATRAAVEEGIVAGGGTTFLDIQSSLDSIEAEGDVRQVSTSSVTLSKLLFARSLTTQASKALS